MEILLQPKEIINYVRENFVKGWEGLGRILPANSYCLTWFSMPKHGPCIGFSLNPWTRRISKMFLGHWLSSLSLMLKCAVYSPATVSPFLSHALSFLSLTSWFIISSPLLSSTSFFVCLFCFLSLPLLPWVLHKSEDIL